MECKIRPSGHAQDMMIERGVSRREMVETINKGAKKLRKKTIISFHRNIEVIYKKKPCHLFIITICRGA